MTIDTEPMYCVEQINIPDKLGEIAKEVIRQQPGNIYEFSARYFAQVCSQHGTVCRCRCRLLSCAPHNLDGILKAIGIQS